MSCELASPCGPLREDLLFWRDARSFGFDRRRFVCSCGRSYYDPAPAILPTPTPRAPRPVLPTLQPESRSAVCACGCGSTFETTGRRRFAADRCRGRYRMDLRRRAGLDPRPVIVGPRVVGPLYGEPVLNGKENDR